MTSFQIQKDKLIEIVSAAQSRTFAEQIQVLEQRGKDLHWLFQQLRTNDKRGISRDQGQLQKRLEQYGSNHKYQPPLKTFCELLKQALDDFILKILIVASIVSIIVQVATVESEKRKTAWLQGFVVLLAVAIVSLITAINNYSKERQFRKLKQVAQNRKKVTIIRNGQVLDLHQEEVLVGDIVRVYEGMEIPADSIVVQSNQITTDQSAMTGQSEPMHKNVLQQCIAKKNEILNNGAREDSDKHQIPSPILMSGTRILTGQGKIMILVVGKSSCIGKISELANQDESSQTPLQAKLQILAQDIGKFGFISAILILLVLLLRFGIEKGIEKTWDTSSDIKELIDYFVLALTVLVVAIPEGLPLAVTLSLAVSVKKMLDDQNLVRRMQACETMGGANNICSDKTGTLTLNKMTLTQLWVGKSMQVDTYSSQISLDSVTTNPEWLELFKINSCVNGTALLHPEEKGSSTELAILKYLKRAKVCYREYREKYPTIVKYPFSSSRKRMSVVLEKEPSKHYLFVKGASQIVLQGCHEWYDPQTNRLQLITESLKSQMESAIKKMAQSSLRTLCLAYKPVKRQSDFESKDQKGVFEIETKGLVLLCIMGVRDIPRKEVPSAIEKCHKAGIKVRMVTGDNIITATAIAKDVGIIRQNDDSLVMLGTEFIQRVGGVICKNCRTKECQCARDSKQAEQTKKPLRIDTIENGKEFDRIKDRLLVLARSRPEDKYALVAGLKERGQVVAATGDGTNDAPALNKADVGFAMGITGTEVARQASAIILLDDNFNSIVKAVLWGRNIYDSIRKFIQFQMTINVVAVTITMIGSALIKQQILAPIQMLWINLIMDTLASLALATESPTEELLNRKPNSRYEHIISRNMMKHIICQAIFQTTVLIILVFWGQLFIPEYSDAYDSSTFASNPQWKWHNGEIGGTVRSGRFITITGSDDYEQIFKTTDVYSRHFTFIFNAFVMMQIFNFINCRKIQDQINIFAGITSNSLFLIIVVGILFLQIILVTFAGAAFHVYANYGLSIQQWMICLAIGSISLPINLLLKVKTLHDPEPEPPKSEGSQENEIVEPTKEELGTQSQIIKIREVPRYPQTKFKNETPPSKPETKSIINIGFH